MFVPKEVPSEKLKAEFIKSNYQMNIIHTYLIRNYKVASSKVDIKKFAGKECAFKRQFKPNITYILNDCEEGKGVFETIVFPKANLKALKNWVEQIYRTQPMDIKNVWYPGKNEYGPEPKEEGCYFKILQQKNRSVIEIWCGS